MIYGYILVMAAVTYLIRVIPMTIFRKKIENRFVKSFLYYVPYTCLTAMTFPAILYATQSRWSALVIPMTIFRKKIENRFVKSFLYYVPYTCLTAMTFPAILYATQSRWSALAGLAAAILLAFYNKSLVTVAAFACLVVFVTEQLAAFL